GNTSLAIRFRCGNPRSDSLRVNEEIRASRATPEVVEVIAPPPDLPPAVGPSAPTPAPAPSPAAAPEPLPSPGGAGPSPVFVDLEPRSVCKLKEVGGRLYSQHPTTDILSAVALIDGRVVVWVPLLSSPLPAADLWPDGHGPALPVDSFAGPELPPPLA